VRRCAVFAVASAIGVGCAALSLAAEEKAAADSQPLRTIPDTLMFKIDEVNEIQGRIASGPNGGGASRAGDSIEEASIYLSTILYYAPSDWTIWVNGVPISANQELGAFEVTDIGPDFVEILVPLSAQGMRPVRLAPNQTFIVRSGAIVDGKWTR
jgi:hypothetical protein